MRAFIYDFVIGSFFSMVEMYLDVYFIEKLFGKINIPRLHLIVYGATVCMFSLVVDFPKSCFILIMSWPLLFFTKSSPLKWIVLNVILLQMLQYVNNITDLLTSYMFYELYDIQFEFDFLCLCGDLLVVFLAMWLLDPVEGSENVHPQMSIGIMVMSIMIKILDTCFLNAISYYGFNDTVEDGLFFKIELPIMIVGLVFDLALCYAYGLFNSRIKIEHKNSELAYQNQIQIEHFENAQTMFQKVRGIRHDIKNQLSTVQFLLENDNIAEARSFISDIIGEVSYTENIIYSGNNAIDSVLDVKLSEARDKGIDVQTKISVPTDLNLKYNDTVCIFGNLIDNAIEANGKNDSVFRRLYLGISYFDGMLSIKVANPSVGEPVNEMLLSTEKEDKFYHGLGINNVRECVERLGGAMKCERSRNIFITSIVLYDVRG